MTQIVTRSDKLKRIDTLLKKVNSKYNRQVLQLASEVEDYGTLSTPFPTVNTLCKGIPRGRFTTIAGPEHTGKGAFCLQLIAHHQGLDPDFVALWTDAESAFDTDWARILGVDLDRVIIQRYTQEQDTMEKILDNSLHIIKETKAIDLWVIDSIGALLPKGDVYDGKDKEKSLSATNMLHLQRKLGEFYRKANIFIAPSADYKGCATVLIGQVYTVPDAHVTLEAVKGGNAVKHWAHLRLLFRRSPRKDWPSVIDITSPDGTTRKVFPGWGGRVKCDKTRLNANEGKEVLLTFNQGRGFDSRSATISAAFGLGLFSRKGAYYSSDLLEEDSIQGRENFVNKFLGDDQLFESLVEKIDKLALENHITSGSTLESP